MTPVSSLYLIVEPGPTIENCLSTILSSGTIPAILISNAAEDFEASDSIGSIVNIAHQAGAVALVQGDAKLALEHNADGIHLQEQENVLAAYHLARDFLGQDSVIGASVSESRHSAMLLGEAGVDYVCFGIPESQHDQKRAKCQRNRLISWWGELFEVPSVAFDVETPDEAKELARAGADFIECRLKSDSDLDDVVAQIKSFSTALRLATSEGR
ncbi:MAG: thiamine phosphate synthase [Hyphomicrobiaceae bacterium]